jgi:Glycine-rich domain-containing protein-like
VVCCSIIFIVVLCKYFIIFLVQVARSTIQDPRFLSEALKRYKGFLYLIKSNQEKSVKSFSVPTYDIDIMWHSHQLCPVSYCNDMVSLLGLVLQHDDTGTDRSVGSKMYDGFVRTTIQFEDTFGLRYWRAAAMQRGAKPTPFPTVPVGFNLVVNGEDAMKSRSGVLSLHPVWVAQVGCFVVNLF